MELALIHKNEGGQAFLGLIFGIIFGFLLQIGGVTRYDVIMGQLLLTDFTVAKVMLSAVAVGMAGFHLLKRYGLARPHIKDASLGANLVGGLIFGVGFALLGYCPGTVAGAVGQGSLDALIGGVTGLLIGAAIFARAYPSLSGSILNKGEFQHKTLTELLHVKEWTMVVLMEIFIFAVLAALFVAGL
ncbi:MAG TPA: YeeE/YedE thiosulfate transporter family protein [Methanoregulaceae archaeon]|nr:YeeE/YedE thiosulfate transporter family protein [Methanoregulaceae archaeon]